MSLPDTAKKAIKAAYKQRDVGNLHNVYVFLQHQGVKPANFYREIAPY